MRFRTAACLVIVFAAAMSYLESAVVVYLQRALAITPDQLFPLQGADVVGDLAPIEVGREVATVVMLAAVGCLAGRRGVDRLAWTAVAFGIWDIGYYFWLWVFIGWPHGPLTWDVLFLIPAPWTGPVWGPLVVSLALVGFGLVVARETAAGRPPPVSRSHALTAVAGGGIVIAAFLANAPAVMSGGDPGWFPWPVFLVGMAVAAFAAIDAVRAGHAVSAGPGR